MIVYPDISPVLLSIGPLQIHWYGVMYLLGFALIWFVANWRARRYQLPWSKDNINDLIFFGAIGVVVGGRLGFMLFYNTAALLSDPLLLFKVWRGGMSFHGGLIGVICALFIFAKKINKSFFEVTDFIAPLVPIGLLCGRLGNFINGELWGRVTDVPWAFVFRHVDNLPRHPSQLYELALEGILLFTLMWLYSAKARPAKSVSAMFLILYGLFRFIAEFYREPDLGIGFVAFNWLTMGQLLSLPMIVGGLLLLAFSHCSFKKEAY